MDLISLGLFELMPPLINDIINDAGTAIDGIYVLRLVKTSSLVSYLVYRRYRAH